MLSEETRKIQQLEQLREIFLNEVDFQRRVKNTSSASDFLKVSIEVARSKNLDLITEEDLRQAIELYASTGQGASPHCPPNTQNPPPFDSPTVEKAIELVRSTASEKCSW